MAAAQDKSARETAAILCSTHAFNEWIQAQGHPLPDPNVRIAKMTELSNACRRPLNLPDMQPATPRPEPPPLVTGGAGDAAAEKLQTLVKSGSIESLRTYLASPAMDVNARPGTDEALLDYAAEQNQAAVAKYLLEHGAQVDAVQTLGRNAGFTALHRAAIADAAQVAEVLLAHGAEVNVHGPLGVTPLMLAASHGTARTAEVLLNHGADGSTPDGHRETALSQATAHGYLDIARLILQHLPTPTRNSLNTVAARGDLDALRLMLQHDELAHDITAQSKDEALRYVLLNHDKPEDRKQMIELLLAHGADVDNVQADPLVIPVMFATTPDMVELLLAHGANGKARLSGAQLAQAYVCNQGVKDPIALLHVLMAHHIDIRGQPSPRVMSAMACALRANNPSVVKFLSDQGIKQDEMVQAAASPGPTAILVAVDPRIVEIRDATIDLKATVVGETVDDVALMMTKNLAPQDPSWNPQNPKWPILLNTIRGDLRADLSARLAVSLNDAQGVWNQAFRASLSEDDMRQLLTFFRSEQGRRYIQLQRQLGALVTRAILEMLQDPAGALANTPETRDPHSDLLNLSIAIQTARAGLKTSTAANAANDPKGSPLESMIAMTVRLHEAELTQLQTTYQRDLAAFTAFNRSAPMGHVLTANQLASSQWSNSSMAHGITAAIVVSATNRMPPWQRAYGSESPQGTSPTVAMAAGKAECVALDKLDRSHQPPEIYRDVRECIERERYSEAAALFALGGIDGRFDAERVLDKTAGQAGQILIMSVSDGLPDDKHERFMASVKAIAADKSALAGICESVKTIGYPTYFPAYMIQHGLGAMMGALSGKQEQAVLDPAFDPQKTWGALQESYLSCPTGGG
jgi:ankyrin repeat protein